MGQRIETKGCGTMYKTVETDKNGNPTNETQWVCSSPTCGAVE